jgi:hypothetical protein
MDFVGRVYPNPKVPGWVKQSICRNCGAIEWERPSSDDVWEYLCEQVREAA